MLRFHLSSVAFLLDLQLKLIIKVVVWSRAAEVWRVCRRSIRKQQKQADKDRTDVTVRHRDTWSIQHLTEETGWEVTDSWLTLTACLPKASVSINTFTTCSFTRNSYSDPHIPVTHTHTCRGFLALRSRSVKTWPVNHRVHTSSRVSNCLKSIWSKSTRASAPIPAHPHHRRHQGLQSGRVQTARDSSASSAAIRSNNLQLLHRGPSAPRVFTLEIKCCVLLLPLEYSN